MKFSILSIFLSFLIIFNVNAEANEIIVTIVGSEERQDFQGKDICELRYEITNNSTGTIHYLNIYVDGWDDRGDKLDELLSAALENTKGLGRLPIPVGSTQKFEMDKGFKTKCKYMGRVKVTDVKPEYCNIRMLPENADCRDMIKIRSNVETILVE